MTRKVGGGVTTKLYHIIQKAFVLFVCSVVNNRITLGHSDSYLWNMYRNLGLKERKTLYSSSKLT